MAVARIEVPIRVVIENPPKGVAWAFQRSKGDQSDLVPPLATAPHALTFEFELQAEPNAGALRWLGPGVQGPPDKRFFYLNSGTLAGDPTSCFTRRAKVSLMTIDPALVETLEPGKRLEIRFAGTDSRGGPACASLKLPPHAWRIA
jgi:hypothetical protein